jgi:hypothetical protein
MNPPTLEALIAGNPDGPPSLEVALQLGVQLVVALHERVLQREPPLRLRPGSLVVSDNGGIVFADAARAMQGPRVTPVQEVFDLGQILHLLLTGRPATELDALTGPACLNPKVDDDLDSLIVTTLQRRPADRPHELAPIFNGLVKALGRIGRKPSAEVVATWAKAATNRRQPSAPRALRAVPRPAAHDVSPAITDESDDFDDPNEVWVEPLKFDGWAAGAIAFSVAAFSMAFML